jgi:DMSO/TMAO reductase YedYZ molybdopterin-dependent catalytic subunit
MSPPSFMDRKRDELRARGIDPQRLPPGQYVTERFPVLHLGPVPPAPPPGEWTLTIGGDGVEVERTIVWDELTSAAVHVTVDIHCVTKWSKLDVAWTGRPLLDLLAPSRPRPTARTLLVHGDNGYTASLDWGEVRQRTALVAWQVDGEPLAPEHGHPARLVVPHLYFWKSVKWVRRIELWTEQRAGFWERNGYHAHGDPFREQRYWGDAP